MKTILHILVQAIGTALFFAAVLGSIVMLHLITDSAQLLQAAP